MPNTPEPTLYKAVANEVFFIAFWKSSDNELSFFDPSLVEENRCYSESLNQWPYFRSTIYKPDDLAEYDDVVNAAWHSFRGRFIDLDRRSATKSTIPRGLYYPRIWRGLASNGSSTYNPIDSRKQYGYIYAQSATAAKSLFSSLSDIFRYIEPTPANLMSYGHRCRELLILTCTEIESGWRAVLDANLPRNKQKDIYNTRDYIKVKTPLYLDQWAVSLSDYPDLGEFSPFQNWEINGPTLSLEWYHAYNAVKHHREVEFQKATLENLLSAMAALHIMQIAQWGPPNWTDSSNSPFTVHTWPNIGIAEIYLPAIGGRDFKPTRYFV